MPASSPPIGPALEKVLRIVGQKLRTRRKNLGLSAIATSEAAGMSRVTLHRIEKGEASVAMGAYLSAIFALGLELELTDAGQRRRRSQRSTQKPPSKIRLADYPELKRLAWQLKGTKELSPKEALDLYERNWRHVDLRAMGPHEYDLVEMLIAAFGRGRLLV